MTDEQINKFFTLMMGKKWYDWHNYYTDKISGKQTCSCGLVFDDDELLEHLHKFNLPNPDFFIPATFREWMIWAGEQEWFEDIIDYIQEGAVEETFYGFNLKLYTDFVWSLDQQIEWFKYHPKKWGYEECPKCLGDGKERFIDLPPRDCDYCNGEGKIKTKSLEYLEEVEK